MIGNKLKICHVTSMHDWFDDRIFERACVGLASIGHEVVFVAPADRDRTEQEVFIKSIKKRNRLGKHLIGPIEAFRTMKVIEADVYHFYNPNMMILMAYWAARGNKVFFDIHENYEVRIDSLPLPYVLTKALRKVYRYLENKICSFYDGLTVVTESMKNKVLSSGTPILIVDNVPFLKQLEKVELEIIKEECPTIITSGTHSDARNCLQAVDALPLIVKEIPNVKMKFVGRFQPASYEDKLKEKAVELGVSKHLETEGMLPWLDNFKRISKAHIGCVFYKDNLNNRVTLPNRLYEYMYCGLAVLGEEFPEVEKVLIDSQAGLTINSLKPEDIASKAITLLLDQDNLKKTSLNARSAIEKKYNFERALEQLEIFYLDSVSN